MAIGGRPAIGEHVFLNAFINESATITENAAADIAEPAHKAVAYDADGNIVLAETGETAIGLILSPSLDPIYAGERVEILIKYIGLLLTSEELLKGDPITITAGGLGRKAIADDFIFGWAFTHSMPGECVHCQITRTGFGL